MKEINVEVRISYEGRSYEISKSDFYSSSDQAFGHVQRTLLAAIEDIRRLEYRG